MKVYNQNLPKTVGYGPMVSYDSDGLADGDGAGGSGIGNGNGYNER